MIVLLLLLCSANRQPFSHAGAASRQPAQGIDRHRSVASWNGDCDWQQLGTAHWHRRTAVCRVCTESSQYGNALGMLSYKLFTRAGLLQGRYHYFLSLLRTRYAPGGVLLR